MNSWLLYATILGHLLFTSHGQPPPPGPQCESQPDGCSCKFSDGGIIDLTSLSNTDGSPR